MKDIAFSSLGGLVMSNICVGDKVAVEQKTILAQLPPDASVRAKRNAECDTYFCREVVDGAYVVENSAGTLRFTAPRGCVLKRGN